jgi:hypothetical protein
MESFYTDYLERLQMLQQEAKMTLQGLPTSALDWLPGQGLNSLCMLAVHTAGAQRYWIGDVVARDKSDRDRESEFRTKGLESGTLIKRLDENLEYIHNSLNALRLKDLESERISPRDGRKVTVSWALGHALSHTAMHVGHMQITRQMWEGQTRGS